MERAKLTLELKQQASELGFSLCGVCPAVAPPGAARLDEWLAAGYAGQMHYLADRREAYGDPNRVLDGVRSIVMLAMNYRTAEPAVPSAGQGRVSRYAWGDADYHDLIRERLNALAEFLRRARAECGRARRRGYGAAVGARVRRSWPASVGSARTRCCSIATKAVGFFWRRC